MHRDAHLVSLLFVVVSDLNTNLSVFDRPLLQGREDRGSFAVEDLHIGVMFLDLDDADVFAVHTVDAADRTDQIAGAQLFAFSGKDTNPQDILTDQFFPTHRSYQPLLQLLSRLAGAQHKRVAGVGWIHML